MKQELQEVLIPIEIILNTKARFIEKIMIAL